MSQELTPSAEEAYLHKQRELLNNLRHGQHKTLIELNIPRAVAQYAIALSETDIVAQEILQTPQANHYFLWRQDVTCIPDNHNRPPFKAHTYKLGMPVDGTTASIFLPNIAARIIYPDGGVGTVFPAALDPKLVRSVIRMADEAHAIPELPGLTGIHPHILSPIQIAGSAPEIWPAADETELIPAPWHPTSFVAPTETITQ